MGLIWQHLSSDLPRLCTFDVVNYNLIKTNQTKMINAQLNIYFWYVVINIVTSHNLYF